MNFTVLDFGVLLVVSAGAIYGVFRGIRPALYLLVGILAAILAVLGLTGVLEALVLDLANIDTSAYTGAPAVAVLLLEDKNTAAYLAALLPLVLSLLVGLVFIVGGMLLRNYFAPPWKGGVSRILGLLCAAIAGLLAVLLLSAQITRLPWPPALISFQGSILMSRINAWIPGLLPTLAGVG